LDVMSKELHARHARGDQFSDPAERAQRAPLRRNSARKLSLRSARALRRDKGIQVAAWRRAHPDEPIPDGQVFTQPWVMGTKADPRKRTIFYQYRADPARRTLKESISRS
jgi:hypothetical protein